MFPELVARAGWRELKNRAAGLIGFSPQPALMGVDDGLANRQPPPQSVGLRGVESLENTLDTVRLDARP